ncbi:hypothetical protein DPMN_172571 [Dreissena polymorpha]|uniref:Uncharacterized protein n=1 Tax=Dreissena polymorpha TaxID=45954 RepID=A0A9D4IGQ9_DREPO|nr:hypothetical protein DPMN_172571 [Dreissena polymorpha]
MSHAVLHGKPSRPRADNIERTLSRRAADNQAASIGTRRSVFVKRKHSFFSKQKEVSSPSLYVFTMTTPGVADIGKYKYFL